MRRTIVVADDEPAIRDLLKRLLQRSGYDVATARDGEDAWQIIQRIAPALVILDVKMPRLGGLDLARRLLGDARFAHLPIIVTSGGLLAEDASSVDAREAGVVYVTKPFSTNMIIAAVSDCLAGRWSD